LRWLFASQNLKKEIRHSSRHDGFLLTTINKKQVCKPGSVSALLRNLPVRKWDALCCPDFPLPSPCGKSSDRTTCAAKVGIKMFTNGN